MHLRFNELKASACSGDGDNAWLVCLVSDSVVGQHDWFDIYQLIGLGLSMSASYWAMLRRR